MLLPAVNKGWDLLDKGIHKKYTRTQTLARKTDKVQLNQLMHVTLTHPVDMIINVDSYTYYYYTEYYNKRWKDNQKQALEYSAAFTMCLSVMSIITLSRCRSGVPLYGETPSSTWMEAGQQRCSWWVQLVRICLWTNVGWLKRKYSFKKKIQRFAFPPESRRVWQYFVMQQRAQMPFSLQCANQLFTKLGFS